MKGYVMNDLYSARCISIKCLLVAVLSAVVLSSCIDEFEADVPSPEHNTIVVQGDIMSGADSKFYITYASALTDLHVRPAKVKDIRVEGSNGECFCGYSLEDDPYGLCIVSVGELDQDVEYSLKFSVLMRSDEWVEYHTEPQKNVKSIGVEDVSFSEVRGDGLVDILVTSEPSDEVQYFKWAVEETWEVHSYAVPAWAYDRERNVIYLLKEGEAHIRGWKTGRGSEVMIGSTANVDGGKIVKHKLYDAQRSDDRFNFLYRTRVIQSTISKQQYDYEVARREMSGDMGGLFTPQPSELPSNVISASGDRAIGYVGVCSTSVFTKYIRATELSEYEAPRPQMYKEYQAGTENAEFLIQNNYLVYSYDPYTATTWWIQGWGVDVTVHPTYASLVRPDDWLDIEE